MARRITRKQLKRDEFVEATFDAGHWLEENWQSLAKWAAALVVVGALVGLWFWNVNRNRARAAELLAAGMREYAEAEEAGFAPETELEQALASFEAAIDKAGGSRPGQLARYYRAAALYRLGRPDEAVAPLEEVSANPGTPSTLLGSARALLAEVHAARGDREQAIGVLEALAEAETPTYPVDQALLALGQLYEERGETARAHEAWQRIVDEFPARPTSGEAQRLLDR